MRNSLKAIAILFSIFSLNQAFGQSSNVGIGTSKPDQSAALDINSNSKGLLMPRMSMDQRNLIQSPAQGLVVYQTDKNSGFYYFNGEQWNALNSNNESSLPPTPPPRCRYFILFSLPTIVARSISSFMGPSCKYLVLVAAK